MKSWKLTLAVALLSLGSTPQAGLIARDAGMVYDDVLNITWAPANLWGTTGTGEEAVAWADSLVYEGFEDWRLASMSVAAGLPMGATNTVVNCRTATEAQCRDNELGYMFYQNLGGSFGDDLTGDQDPFTDIQPYYWSGTELASDPGGAWLFHYDDGLVVVGKDVGNDAAWAVRAG
jgi:hypothetical protein